MSVPTETAGFSGLAAYTVLPVCANPTFCDESAGAALAFSTSVSTGVNQFRNRMLGSLCILFIDPTKRSVLDVAQNRSTHPQYFPQVGARYLARRMPLQGLFSGLVVAVGHVGEAGGIVEECQVKPADGAVALLGNNDFGFAL